jgi:hypothetical protein
VLLETEFREGLTDTIFEHRPEGVKEITQVQCHVEIPLQPSLFQTLTSHLCLLEYYFLPNFVLYYFQECTLTK